MTDAGQELIDGILTAGAAHQRRLLDRLDANGLATIERALQLMLGVAEAERADSVTWGPGCRP